MHRRVKGLLTLIALTVAAAALVALPSASRAGSLEPPLAASSNVHLLAHIPGTAAGMNFKDQYAYVTGWSGVTVLDIANPPARASPASSPSRTSRTRTSTSAATRCSSPTTARRRTSDPCSTS
jgi:hypothetical protein